MNNIGQFTEESDFPIVKKSISIYIPDGTSPNGGRTENFNVQYMMIYKTAFGGSTITKISYCCEPAAQYFPVSFNGDSQPNTYVGKNGMLEYQKETLINKEEGQKDPKPDFITGNIYLPICFSKNDITTKPDQKFKQTLDFVLEV